MRIPKKVLIVGFVESITWQRDKSRAATTIDYTNQKDSFLLATNQGHTHLYIFKNKSTGKIDLIRDKSGAQKGFIHQVVHYEIPSLSLSKIGKVIRIRYRSTWWTGELEEYRHDFENSTLWSDKYTRFETIGIKPKSGKILNQNGIIS